MSLIGYERVQPVGEASSIDIWQRTHVLVSSGKGDTADHAILLCNLFLGFAIDAYVTLGMDKNNMAHAWVTTIDHLDKVSFWESLTGMEYKQSHGFSGHNQQQNNHHFRSVGCCFNGDSFFANIQASDSAERVDFNFQDTKKWKAISKDAIYSMKRFLVCLSVLYLTTHDLLNPICLNRLENQSKFILQPNAILNKIPSQEQEIEMGLKQYIEHYREDHDLGCLWDEDLCHLLGQSLWAFEFQKLTSTSNVGVFNEDFQIGIKRSIPEGHTFKVNIC